MPVANSDIRLYKSSIGASEGGTASATEITGTTLNNLFANLSDAQRIAGGLRYKKEFLGNTSGLQTMIQPKVWVNPDAFGFPPTQLGVGWNDTDDDSFAQGNMTAFAADALAELVSSAADTRTVTLLGIDDATGECITENVVLNGTTPELSNTLWSKLLGARVDAENGTNTITIKQGAAGTTRGTIGPNTKVCWLWVLAGSEGSALVFPDLVPGGRQGIWEKQTWDVNEDPSRPTDPVLNAKEGA